MNLFFVTALAFTGLLGAQATPKQKPPAMVVNGKAGAMHYRLDALVGEWDVTKSLFIAGGTPQKPLVGHLTCRREWIPGTEKRHLRDVMTGSIGVNPYFREGILSYSNMDKRYEWNTVDALNAGMMTYKGVKGSATSSTSKAPIVMVGEFTDQGVLGQANVGKTIRQRTVIRIESPNRCVFELYFTPPGQKERLVDRGVYTRHIAP